PLLIPIQGVISLAGVSDLQRMWEIHFDKEISSPVASFIGGTPQEVPDRYRLASPIELLPLNIEQILVHGNLDCDVPVELSVEYHRKAIEQGDKVKLVMLPKAEHFKIIDPLSSAWGSVIDSLENLLWRKSNSNS
ncbi:MAG: hydrolase, partial [Neobacillus sp.]|nr:hydrolase [Neobacillus sp.]